MYVWVMRHTTFGNTGLRTSEAFLGAMGFGEDWGWGVPPDECRKIFNAYAEAGGNVIDTANRYTDGASERIVGELLGADRERFVLATKYTLTMDGTDPNASGSHRKNLRRSVEDSLRRLGTDYIDLLWVHIWDAHTPIEETMRALDDVDPLRQGALHRTVRRTGLGCGPREHHGRAARVDAVRWAPAQLQPAGAWHRTRAASDGRRPEPVGRGLGAAGPRRADRQVHPRRRHRRIAYETR
jgi:aryl-alcohol dehydrogenase-like predicted oxidoreductase